MNCRTERKERALQCFAEHLTTERTVGQHAAILTSKGNTLSHALVDDIVRNLCQTINVGLTSTIVNPGSSLQTEEEAGLP